MLVAVIYVIYAIYIMCCIDTKGIISIYWLILLCTLTHILSSFFKKIFENPWIKKFTKL